MSGCVAALVAPLLAQPAATLRQPEATSLSGKPLYPPDPIPNREKLEEDLAIALSVTTTAQPEAMITIGRRHAYLWRYREAIDWFTRGIARLPGGRADVSTPGPSLHHDSSVRSARKPICEKAATLIRGTADQVEPTARRIRQASRAARCTSTSGITSG